MVAPAFAQRVRASGRRLGGTMLRFMLPRRRPPPPFPPFGDGEFVSVGVRCAAGGPPATAGSGSPFVPWGDGAAGHVPLADGSDWAGGTGGSGSVAPTGSGG